ncbi:MAG: preprotein translocase subunit SecE, partial [Clostridiales bacterium]|nr:preprotein translocase subunit SecE [Clostridiales bacterium]
IGRRFKETFAELKKVSWPAFPKVMKQTSIVLGVVLFFLVIIFAFDLGLSQLYQLLFPQAPV